MSRLDLIGLEIYLDSHHVATLQPNVYGTLLQRVEDCVNTADTEALERECEDVRKAEADEWKEQIEERDERIANLETQVTDLEADNESLSEKLIALEDTDDKATALLDALEEIESLKDTITDLRSRLAPPAPKRRRASPRKA